MLEDVTENYRSLDEMSSINDNVVMNDRLHNQNCVIR